MIIDVHCHLDFEQFDEDRDEVIARAKKNNVKIIIKEILKQNPSLNVKSLP